MIYPYEKVAALEKAVKLNTHAQQVLGGEGQLVVLLPAAAPCTLQKNGEVAAARPGRLYFAPGPLAVLPQTGGEVAGVVLSGLAVDALVRFGGGVQAVPQQASAVAAPLLLRLLAGQGHTEKAEESTVVYALVCSVANGAGGETPQKRLPLLVEAAVAEMNTHYGEVYGVEELAAGLEVSKSHLVRVFSKNMGTSPGKYLTMVRLAAAQKLLLHSDYALEIIAGLCGFSGANYFCRIFKKELGMPPAAWRKENMPRAWQYPADFEEGSQYL